MRDKQIEEMARTIYNGGSYDTHYTDDSVWLAEDLYNAGYRKASDVAREIGAILSGYNAGNYAEVTLLNKFYELKKKYESEGDK